MDSSSMYFLILLNSYIKQNPPPRPDNVDWNKIYKLASIHSLNGAIYLAVQKLNDNDKPDREILKNLKHEFYNTTVRYEKQEEAYSNITNKLSEYKLTHLPFKGIVIRNYYPVKQMRTSGDIDILIKENDHNSVHEALTQIGFKNINKSSHWIYIRDMVILEVHSQIMYRQISPKADYISYFRNIWDYAVTDYGYAYKLKLEYNLVLLFAHTAKHFYKNGAGVRMILDIAVILDKYGNTLDYKLIWDELKKLKLDAFALNIFYLCSRWFYIKLPGVTFDMEDSTYETVSKYILEGGTFGFNDRNEALSIIRKEYETTNNSKLAQIRAFKHILFLNYDDMKTLYPILNMLPFLLPLFWINRGITRLYKRRKRTLGILNGLFKCSEQAELSYEMMKKIGL